MILCLSMLLVPAGWTVEGEEEQKFRGKWHLFCELEYFFTGIEAEKKVLPQFARRSVRCFPCALVLLDVV